MRRTKTSRQKEENKAREDPNKYERRDPPIYNPIRFVKYLIAKSRTKDIAKAADMPFRELYSKSAFGIPTTKELERYRDEQNRAIASEMIREAEAQFRESTPRPVKPGYQFQILKS